MADRKNTSGRTKGRPRSTTQAPIVTNSAASSSRTAIVLVAFLVLALLFLVRLFYLQVVVADEYSTEAQEARTANIQATARRGTIYDRNGNILATSVPAMTIYANPKEVTDVATTVQELARILGGDEKDYREKIEQSDLTFVYIERKVDTDVAERVQELKLNGIYFLDDTKRVYPYGQVAGQIIGLVDIDGEGQTGLELYYDDILCGTDGKLVVERGVGGIPIPGGVREETPSEDGEDIILTIDVELQKYLETRLEQGAEENSASSSNSIIMDAETGEIYACASLPYLNPSDRSKLEVGAETLKSITSAFEPGSIFKTVPVLGILENGTMNPDTTINTPASIKADGYTISDAHERGDETMSLREILDRSSNVGVSLATENYLGFGELNSKIEKYNLGQLTGVDYPGEEVGYLLDFAEWSKIQSYNITFGQGISVTPIQMTNFYCAIANNGVQFVPHFLLEKPLSDEQTEYEPKQIIENKEALNTLVSMLETVVKDGTGKLAQIDGYTVAGKTSTAEIAKDTGGYKSGVYNICFAGFLPKSSSQLVCFVGVADVPFEGTATTIFKDIMSFAIERYNITEGSDQ